MAVALGLMVALMVIVVIVLLALISSGIKTIGPHERGVYLRLGRFVRVLEPGINFVPPLVSTVVKIDVNPQVIEVPTQEVFTRDRAPIVVAGAIRLRVTSPTKAFLNVTNYRTAIIYLGQSTLRQLIGGSTLDEVRRDPQKISTELNKKVKQEGGAWGLSVDGADFWELAVAPTQGSLESRMGARHQPNSGIRTFKQERYGTR